MKCHWLHRRRKEQLIIFCNGWGMDATPFSPLGASEYDVLMLFDYEDMTLACDLQELFREYQQVYLVSWSMGVWVGQQVFQSLAHLLTAAVAMNGTLCPIHDQFGIPRQVYDDTLGQYSAPARLKLYRRMCREPGVLDCFLAHQPQRSVESQSRELVALRTQVSCGAAEAALYTTIVVANRDLVVPTAHQLAFWKERAVARIDGAHFLFYHWQTWDDLLVALIRMECRQGKHDVAAP